MSMDLDQNESKTTSNSIEIELKEHLDRMEKEAVGTENPKENIGVNPIKPIHISDGVLDFLQDKPIKIQEIFICKNLSPDQKKEIQYIFKANEHELAINRAGIKHLLEKLCAKYPELEPYFSNEAIFFATFVFGYFERQTMVDAVINAPKKAI